MLHRKPHLIKSPLTPITRTPLGFSCLPGKAEEDDCEEMGGSTPLTPNSLMRFAWLFFYSLKNTVILPVVLPLKTHLHCE
jgi:hypothetical protein